MLDPRHSVYPCGAERPFYTDVLIAGINGVGVKFTVGLHDFKSISRSTPQLLVTVARVVTFST